MSKNLIIVIAVILVVVAGAFSIFRGKEAIDVSVWQGDENELANWESVLEMFSQEDALGQEIDQTFGDVLDEQAGLGIDAALDETSINQEASKSDFSETLDDFTTDDAALLELNQVIGEVSQ